MPPKATQPADRLATFIRRYSEDVIFSVALHPRWSATADRGSNHHGNLMCSVVVVE
jgi:hypothetical protein